jgi:hypothetical protein
MDENKEVKASDFKCCKCKKESAVAFWPIVDPDIPSYPYCRKCLDKEKIKLLIYFSTELKLSNE